jgi:hypothetical protein
VASGRAKSIAIQRELGTLRAVLRIRLANL